MLFLSLFFALLIVFSNTAAARLSVSSHEEGPALKRVQRVSQEHHGAGQSAKGRRSSKAAGHQGQATSSAYSKENFTIQVDLAADDVAENEAGGAEGSVVGGDNGLSHPQYSTASGLGAQPISSNALQMAKAKHELKRKLQADNQKKFRLLDIAKEKDQKDPREEIINELMKASQDIEK